MFVEIDQAVVDTADWEKAKGGDEGARARIRLALNGIVLYEHAISAEGTCVTIRELAAAEIIQAVTISVEAL